MCAAAFTQPLGCAYLSRVYDPTPSRIDNQPVRRGFGTRDGWRNRSEIVVASVQLLPTESWTRKKYAEPTTFSAVERRLLVRSVFSFIEALIYRLKIGALLETEERLSPGEVALAKEEDYELADSGTVQTRNARLRFLSNFRFAFCVSAKASDVEFHLDVGGDGWTALRCALSVRDRITHPKVAGDLVISDDEVRSAMKAYTWALDQWGILALTSLRHHLKKRGEP
jgi:hypothetical protein